MASSTNNGMGHRVFIARLQLAVDCNPSDDPWQYPALQEETARANPLGREVVFLADVEELFYFGDDGAGLVFDFDGEDSFDLFFGG
jgi:hypothetical protein